MERNIEKSADLALSIKLHAPAGMVKIKPVQFI
jgi:hypothetical protein